MNKSFFKFERSYDIPKDFYKLTNIKYPKNGIEVVDINGIRYANILDIFSDNFSAFLTCCYLNDARYIVTIDDKIFISPICVYILAEMIINNTFYKINCVKTKKEIQKTYIIRDQSSGLVKIGRSKNPYERIKSISAKNPNFSLVFISDHDYEAEIHKELSSFRESGEWFLVPKFILDKIVIDFNFKMV